MDGYRFPPWIDRTRPFAGALLAIVPVYIVFLAYYWGSPQTTDVGYSPVQPLPYSHAMHAGQLGMDCRYCHNTVEWSAFAAVPPTATCLNCHATIAPDSAKLLLIRQSAADGDPVHWVKVHDLPDYVYFDHSATCLAEWDAFPATGGSTRWSRLPKFTRSAWAGAWSATAIPNRNSARRNSSPKWTGFPTKIPKSWAKNCAGKQHQSIDGLLDMSSLEKTDNPTPSPLLAKPGRAYNTPEFRPRLEAEFPAKDDPAGISRRRWLQLMGASFVLAGAASCRWEKREMLAL